MIYPADIDYEIVPFLENFNTIPGVESKFSCCGHGKEHWYVSAYIQDIHVLHTVIERFSRIGCLQFKFKFFDDVPQGWNIGIYSEVLGRMPDFMRVSWQNWLVIQCDKIKKILNGAKDNGKRIG